MMSWGGISGRGCCGIVGKGGPDITGRGIFTKKGGWLKFGSLKLIVGACVEDGIDIGGDVVDELLFPPWKIRSYSCR